MEWDWALWASESREGAAPQGSPAQFKLSSLWRSQKGCAATASLLDLLGKLTDLGVARLGCALVQGSGAASWGWRAGCARWWAEEEEVWGSGPAASCEPVETRSSVGSSAHVCAHVHVSRFRLIVGAPTASWLANASVVNPGAIYRCKIGKNPDLNCEQLQLGELGLGPGGN